MTYDKKLLEEKRKYGKVSCPICKQRIKEDWNIYSAISLCGSQECHKKMIDKLLSNPELQKHFK